ncbi:MAG: CHAT domain-containing tetratricopeptide repeat protein [Bacteroidota bacterium]
MAQENILKPENQSLGTQSLEATQERKVYNGYLQNAIDYALSAQEAEEWQVAIDTIQSVIKTTKPYVGISSDTLLALAYHKLGVSYYYLEPPEDQKAIQNYQNALKIRSNCLIPNHIDIIKSNRNIGLAYRELNQYKQSRKYLQTALDLHLSRSVVDSVLLASTYMDLGDVLSMQREFEPAKKYLSAALDMQKRIYPNALWEWTIIYERLYDLSKNQSDTTAMFHYSKTLIGLLEPMEEKYPDDYELLANAYNNLALAYEMSDALNLAMSFYQKSFSVNQGELENRHRDISKNFSNISLIYQKQKKYQEALASVNKAIEIAQAVDDPLLIAASLNNKASILADQGNLMEALRLQQQAIQHILPNFQSNDPYTNPPTKGEVVGTQIRLIKYLADKADVLQHLALQQEKEKNLIAVSAIYDSIAELSHQIRIRYQSDDSKHFLSAEMKAYFEKGIAVNYELYHLAQNKHYLEKAFALAQQSKAVVLLDALYDSDAKIQAGIPEHLVQREDQLKQQLANTEYKILSKSQNQSALRSNWLQTNNALEKLIDTFRNDYTKYYELKYQLSATHLSDLRQNSEETILEYFLGQDDCYAFVLNKAELEGIKWKKDFSLEANIRQLQAAIQLQNNLSSANYEAQCDRLVQNLHFFYENIFAPVEEKIQLPKHLRIIPDGVLGYLPFELFIKRKASSSSYFKQHHYLLKDYQISYAYSANLLEKPKTLSVKKGNRKLLAIAPSFQAIPSQSSTATKTSLVPMKYNLTEANAIHQNIGGDLLTGQTATKARFLALATDYQILHFATHAKANDEIGDFSYLAFTTSDRQDTLSSLLYNRELYQLQLKADMVVLSACETGLGELKAGEGIISMARGFSYAGAKSIVTSLWEVNDVATKDLMVTFYEYLQTGSSKDEALRLAKLDYIQSKDHVGAHPFYWAAFIAIGDMEAIESTFAPKWWVFFVLFLFVLFVATQVFRKNSSLSTKRSKSKQDLKQE